MPDSEESPKESKFVCENGFKGKRVCEEDLSGPGVTRSNSSSTDDDISLPAPPDGGWGWVVVFASFMAHLIADGCAFSFGVLFEELLDYFQESTAKTAWVGSLFVSIPLITGPIASALTNKYGCRRVTMVGGLIAGIGMISSSFVNSIGMLCLTYGVIAGFGFSMVYVPCVITVAFYFEKRRAFATGIAVAGSGIGTFIFAPLTEILIQQYSWSGALLIIGGLVFNIIACGACFRPLESQKLMREKQKMRKSVEKFSRMSSRSIDTDELKHNGFVTGQQLIANGDDYEPITHSLINFPTYVQKSLSSQSPAAMRDFNCDVRNNRHLTDNFSTNLILLGDKVQTSSSIDVHIPQSNDTEDVDIVPNSTCSPPVIPVDSLNHVIHIGNGTTDLLSKKKIKKIQESDQFLPLNRKDIFYRGSLMRTGFFLKNGRATSCPDIFVHTRFESESSLSDRCSLLNFSKEVKQVFREMLDVSICKSVLFVHFCIHSMLLYLCYDNPYVYLPEYASSLGISSTRSSYLLSIIGIVSTVGQIFMGYMGDQPRVDTVHFYNAMTTTAGVITLLVPLMKNYTSLAVYCGGYGFFISANYALTTIILVDLLGMEKLTNAYGLVSLAEGISTLVGPPLAGWLYDITGSFDLTFYFSGAIIMISGLMLFAIPCLNHCDKLKRQHSKEHSCHEVELDSMKKSEQEENESSQPDSQLVESQSVPDVYCKAVSAGNSASLHTTRGLLSA